MLQLSAHAWRVWINVVMASGKSAFRHVLGMNSFAGVRAERVRGRILRPAAKAAEEGQAAPLAGKVTFEDEAGNVRSCFYTLDQARHPMRHAPLAAYGPCWHTCSQQPQ